MCVSSCCACEAAADSCSRAALSCPRSASLRPRLLRPRDAPLRALSCDCWLRALEGGSPAGMSSPAGWALRRCAASCLSTSRSGRPSFSPAHGALAFEACRHAPGEWVGGLAEAEGAWAVHGAQPEAQWRVARRAAASRRRRRGGTAETLQEAAATNQPCHGARRSPCTGRGRPRPLLQPAACGRGG